MRTEQLLNGWKIVSILIPHYVLVSPVKARLVSFQEGFQMYEIDKSGFMKLTDPNKISTPPSVIIGAVNNH
jgi:hypothetical protein